MDARQFGVTIALSLLLLPSAFAGWAVKGAREPDTPEDLTSGWMALTPDVLPTSGPHVYFNGFPTAGGTLTTTLSPNLATGRSAFVTLPLVPAAFFGIWKDCNRDGFVGLGDQGLLEYSAKLLANASVCLPTDIQGSAGAYVHNDGNWVVEFFPIGYDDTTTPDDENPLNVNDTTARVWADWGRPGAAPGLTCATFPAPHGAFRSTGGFLRWIDCFSAFRVTGAVNTLAATTGLDELSFADAPRDRPDQSASLLNQPNPWGSEGDASSARVFDCREPTPLIVEDPTGGRLRNIATIPVGDRTLYVNGTDSEGRILATTVFAANPDVTGGGSPAGTVNETEAELTDCDRNNPGGEHISINGRNGGSDAELPYALEGPNEPIAGTPRTQTDYAFTFEEGARRGDLATLFGARARDDAALSPAAISGFWMATGASLVGQNAFVDNREAAIEPVAYLTYYGYVSTALVSNLALRMPSGSGYALYGVDGCFAGTFACDPALWWKDSAGNDIVPRDAHLGSDPNDPTTPNQSPATAVGVRMGQRYQMRDLDCFDQSTSPARENGIHWGRLTNTACVRPAP